MLLKQFEQMRDHVRPICRHGKERQAEQDEAAVRIVSTHKVFRSGGRPGEQSPSRPGGSPRNNTDQGDNHTVAVKIRLRRVGAKKQPAYRVVVADSRSPRDGRFIEIIGHYNPLTIRQPW